MPISLCMIAKNEEGYIERAINSVKPIADEIIVAIDEESSDKTEETAKRLGAGVYRHKWKNDFSEARNFSISKATKEWIFVLDADEAVSKKDLWLVKRLTEKEDKENNKNRTNPRPKGRGINHAVFGIENCRTKVRGIKPTIFNKWKDEKEDETEDVTAYSFIQRTYTNDASLLRFQSSKGDSYEESKIYRGWVCSYVIRLFKNNRGIAYSGVVHENVLDSLKKIKGVAETTRIPIHHYGKLKPDVEKKSEKYLELGKKKAAMAGNAKSYRELAIQQQVLGRLEESAESFKKAIGLERGNIDNYINLGSVYIKQGLFKEAADLMEAGLKIKEIKESPDLYNNLGVAYEKMGKSRAAVEAFKKSVLLKESPESYMNMARVYLKQGLLEDVIKILKRVIAIDPVNAGAYNNLAGLYISRQEYDEAAEILAHLKKLEPEKEREIEKRIKDILNLKSSAESRQKGLG